MCSTIELLPYPRFLIAVAHCATYDNMGVRVGGCECGWVWRRTAEKGTRSRLVIQVDTGSTNDRLQNHLLCTV